MTTEKLELFEVFVRPKRGLDHKHVGSLHAQGREQALEYARERVQCAAPGLSSVVRLFTIPMCAVC